MKIDFIRKAQGLMRKGKYSEVIKLLEQEIVRFQDSYIYHYILALACLELGDTGGAFTYFSKANKLHSHDPNPMLGIALLLIKKGDFTKAIEYYLNILDLQPKNQKAKIGLEIIRNYKETDYVDSTKINKKLKKIKPVLPPKDTVNYGVIIVIGLLGLSAVAIYLHNKAQSSINFSKRPGIENSQLTVDEIKNPITKSEETYSYSFSEQEIVKLYRQALLLFLEYRDESARVIINKLKRSNASDAIKAKADLLLSHSLPPSFASLKDKYDFTTVMKEPELYESCHVIWKGMATNLNESDTEVVFELLINYDENYRLEGIVPVYFNIPIVIDPSRPIEVLGSIKNYLSNGKNKIMLLGLSIHQALN